MPPEPHVEEVDDEEDIVKGLGEALTPGQE